MACFLNVQYSAESYSPTGQSMHFVSECSWRMTGREITIIIKETYHIVGLFYTMYLNLSCLPVLKLKSYIFKSTISDSISSYDGVVQCYKVYAIYKKWSWTLSKDNSPSPLGIVSESNRLGFDRAVRRGVWFSTSLSVVRLCSSSSSSPRHSRLGWDCANIRARWSL